MAEGGNICGLLNLTVKCNQNCLFCCDGDVKDSGYHLTFGQACERVAQIASQGADSITFIGGEPLVQKYLPDLVRFSREQGLRVGLTTNGTLLTAPRLDALMDAGLTSLEISIHSFDAGLSDVISRKRGTVALQRAALELLKARQGAGAPGLSINFVLFARNYQELPDFARTVVTDYPFVDEFFVNFLDPIGYPAHDHSLLPGYLEVQPFLLDALEVVAKAGLSFTVDSVPGCILGPYALFLRATREKLRGVRYAKQTLRIVNSAPDPDLSQYYRVNACHLCPISGLCPGVNFRYLGIRGEGEFRPFPVELLKAGKLLMPREAPASLGQELARASGGPVADGPVRPLLLTRRCNNHCRWCGCSGGGKEPAPGKLTRALSDLVSGHRPGEVLLMGGEPALHPQFFAIIRELSRAGRRVAFSTNGRLFAYESWVRKALASGARAVELHLPAPLGALADCLSDGEAPAQTLRGLENLLRERRLAVRLRLCVPAGTAALVDATLEFLADQGVFAIAIETEGPVETSFRAMWQATASRLRLSLA
jgi:MoaA/NifB/PqqE/SkfB family radical SAM enzyme